MSDMPEPESDEMGRLLADFDRQANLEAALLEDELRRRPIPAVLDTSCVRTGLAHMLRWGEPPKSLQAAQQGKVRMYMERETLYETGEKLPLFAEQLNVSLAQLIQIFVENWLPLIRVVTLPAWLRELEVRPAEVRELDPDDYPAAALAALLSPCVLLTDNYRDFRPLGVTSPRQGVKAVIAVLEIDLNERRLGAVGAIPTAPVVAIGLGTKWAADRIGGVAWALLGLAVLAGIFAYLGQPPERKEQIKTVAGKIGEFLLTEAAQASASVQSARQELYAYVVPGPDSRTWPRSAIRELAIADNSMSAQQLYDALDGHQRPSVTQLRSFLHKNKQDLLLEAHRGSFILGRAYTVRSTEII